MKEHSDHMNEAYRRFNECMEAMQRQLDEEFLKGDVAFDPVGILASENPDTRELERMYSLESPK